MMNVLRTLAVVLGFVARLLREAIALSLAALGTGILWFVAYGVTCRVLNSLPAGGIETWTLSLDGLFGRRAADAIFFYGTTMILGLYSLALSLAVEGRFRRYGTRPGA